MAVLCESETEAVIGTGCETVEDNGDNQEVSCWAAETLFMFPRRTEDILAICPGSQLLEE
jgi:hypothetical protein